MLRPGPSGAAYDSPVSYNTSSSQCPAVLQTGCSSGEGVGQGMGAGGGGGRSYSSDTQTFSARGNMGVHSVAKGDVVPLACSPQYTWDGLIIDEATSILSRVVDRVAA